ncbi:glycosyltransferase family 4 protein [Lysinibacillus sp. NPDC097214]|uniref:glycosyltransferase family 4 protein n=1 Tax=Lysinibacillus sp. NPDC097214 TaxID=3390584 RepID=UPI003D02A732
MNICFLLGGFTSNGGIGRVTSILANTLCNDDKYRVYSLSYFNNGRDNLYNLDKKVQQNFLFEDPLNMAKGILRGGILKLRKYFKKNNIDVVIACGALYFPIVVLSCKGLKTKCICWEHSNAQNSKDHSFQSFCRWVGAKNSDLVVTLTKHDKQNYIDKYHIKNVKQIYNPIDEEIFNYAHQYNINSKKLLSVGRLSYPKNFGMLIDIAKEVLVENPDWTWDIYGEGALKDELENKIKEYGLEKRITLKGQVNNLYSLYNEYSLLIMTSRYEGFPMTLLEGIAQGLPLISFDVLTGPNEIIEHCINGYLIKPFDTDQMISSTNYLINNSEKRREMSENSKVKCGDFKLSEIIVQWKQLIDAL